MCVFVRSILSSIHTPKYIIFFCNSVFFLLLYCLLCLPFAALCLILPFNPRHLPPSSETHEDLRNMCAKAM